MLFFVLNEYHMKRFLLAFLLPACLTWSSMQQMLDWAPVKDVIQKADLGTWVFFDVDEVLITPEDTVFHPANHNVFETHAKRLSNKMDREALIGLWGALFSVRKARLVDAEILEVLKLVKQKRLQTFALTHCGTGKVGCIERLEDWRIKELKSLGIHFEQLNDYEIEWIFEDLPGKHGIPILKKGVIFASALDKGEVLSKVFDVIGHQPQRVIFVDDKYDNLMSVKAACLERGIEFIGFEYLAVAHSKPSQIDLRKVEIQFQILENEKKWLSDREIELFMEESR